MSVLDMVRDELSRWEREGLLRRPVVVDADGVTARIDDREAILFCSNDYLGFTTDPTLSATFSAAVLEHGVGAGASRLISGTTPVHRAAELHLAKYVGMPDALLFSSGYAANVGAIAAVLGRGDVAFSDRLNHASLIDGLRLSRAEVHVYEHRDPASLEHLLRAHRHDGRRAWIVTESLFSMDGDVAPLARLRALADGYDAGLYVDDAHAIGVLETGRGLCHELGVRADLVLGTLGKAAGLSGAFVAGAPELRTLLENRARSYVYSTAVSPALAATAIKAADLLEHAHAPRARLRINADRVRRGLHQQGWRVSAVDHSPIVPVEVGSPAAVMQLSVALLARGIFVAGVRPPTVPAGTSRLRVVASALHTDEHVAALLDAFEALR